MNLALLSNSSDDAGQPVVELVQEMIDALFALPPADGNFRQIVKLPENNYVFPRHKPIPVVTTTKWEEFAKSKGIQKRKRDRMVFDETTEEYKPRFGKDRAMADKLPPIMPLKQHEAWDVNPFQVEKDKKKLVELKQKQRTLKNQERNYEIQNKDKAKIKNLVNDDFLVTSRKAGGSEKKNKSKSADEESKIKFKELFKPSETTVKKKEILKKKLKLAQVSTASLGRHDVFQKNEPEVERGNKKRKFLPNINDASEKDRALKLLQKL